MAKGKYESKDTDEVFEKMEQDIAKEKGGGGQKKRDESPPDDPSQSEALNVNGVTRYVRKPKK